MDDQELEILGESAHHFRDGFKKPKCEFDKEIGVYKIRKILTDDFNFVDFMKMISDGMSCRFKIKANLKFFTHYHPYFTPSSDQKIKFVECEFLEETVEATDESHYKWNQKLNAIGEHYLWAAFERDTADHRFDYDYDDEQVTRKAFVLDISILLR